MPPDASQRRKPAWYGAVSSVGQDPAALASFYAENGSLTINDGQPSTGRAAIEATARSFMEGFPDMVVRLVEVRRRGDRVLFDWHWTGTHTGPGGTGKTFDWDRIPQDMRENIVLAGGLKPDNVEQAIRRVRPFAVDVSGGVEREKGIKDTMKILAFMRGVEHANQ